MSLPPGFLEELRSRISLAGLVGRQVRLVRKGREFAGLCPFHHEKTPSFYVVEDKSFFHCFGCGAHGDAIGFVMRAENLDFIAAVEKLAGEAGLPVPKATPEERERAQRQKTLLEALEAACAFYETRLWSTAGRAAREYLVGRGLDEETIRRFRLGAATEDRHALRRGLGSDFPEPLLVEAGLLRRADSGEVFDYFRDRVLFPIGDRAGRIIAFGGRILGDGQPKYLNSPEGPVFQKGRVLYGWSAARAQAARESDAGRPAAIVTEGYMDVIALHRAGFATAVAPLGTALTEAQLQELWRFAAEPVLCFDGDAAGERAAIRALRRALPLLRAGQSLRFASLPAGEDPDSLIRNRGAAAFEAVLAAARPLSAVLWDSETGGRPLDTPERRAELRRRLDEDAALIVDGPLRDEFRAYFRRRLFETGQARRPGRQPAPPRAPFDRGQLPRSPARLQREILLRILLRFPELIDEVEEEFAQLEVPEPDLDKLRAEILRVQALRPGLDPDALRQHLVLGGFAATVDALLSPSVDSRFLARRTDSEAARRDWDHVIRMLMGGERSGLAEVSDQRIDGASEVSPEGWQRFLAAREQALHEGVLGDDQS